ncbi:MAG: Wzz/FepE/Etk N-terminal domain-containing protein [Lachnospiraceae bacterium]|nr:Wzz/FepE/Etk N-terminal domain-containing protein [Lachnospiraceae bacterium]
MEKYDNDEIDLKELFFELKKRWWMILVAMILGAGAFGAYSKFVMVPQYKSTSMVYVLSKETTLTSLADLQIGSQLTKDYSVIVTSRPVLQQAIDNLGIYNMSYRDLRKKLTIDNPSDTRIMSLTVTDKDPYTAKALVDSVAQTSSQYIAEIMEMTPPKIVEDGEIPTVQSSPNTKKNAAIGGLLGAVLVGGIIVLMTIMNDTIKTEDDIERYLGLSLLASIPDRDGKDGKGYGRYGKYSRYGDYGYGETQTKKKSRKKK